MSETPRWFIGVDGGATRCRARLRDGAGVKRAEASGAAANIHVEFPAAVEVLRGVLGEVSSKAGLGEAPPAGRRHRLRPRRAQRCRRRQAVVAAFPGFALVRAANDATAACIGAHAGEDGGLVIAGTGSAAIARVGGRETIVGGRGFTLGDDGSGARIGLEALRAATRAADGLGPMSALTVDILAAFNQDVVAMLRWARTAKPGDFGGFAPRVFSHAGSGRRDRARHRRRRRRGERQSTRRAVELGAPRMALVGGAGEALRPALEPGIAALLRRPLFDATDGAILLVGGAAAREREAVG